MPPAKMTVVRDTPKKTEKPVAGSNWFKPWLKPTAADVAKKTPEAAVKATPKKKPAAAVAKKAPKAAVKATPKKKPAVAAVTKKAPKAVEKAKPKK